MSLAGNKNKIAVLSKDLGLRWQETRQQWRDARGAEFDLRYMQDLFTRSGRAVEAIEKLDEILKKVRKDCE